MPLPADHHGFIPSSQEDMLRRRVKVELRKRMRGVRGNLPPAACAERSGLVAKRLLALEAVAGARAVALFWPMERRREVDLRAVDAVLRGRGVRIAYPAIDAGTGAMAFRFVADPSAMVEDAQGLGLREPAPAEPEASPGELDVIVVPALAVDPRGYRIGYGGGYYDRALPRLVPPGVSVAVAFDFQLLVEAPATEGDVPTQYVVTDARSLQA